MIAHPFADRFPMLSEDELDRLATDIAENGLNSPIVLDGEGRILDGRNRWAACERAGVTPETVPFDGDDEAAFVLSVNVTRRHMTTGQQAMSTALVLSDAGKRNNGKWAYGSISNVEDSPRSTWIKHMSIAGFVLDHADDLASAVVAGEIALDAAFREAEKRRDAERQNLAEQERIEAEEADARKRLTELAPEYLDRYEDARVAFTAWESDNRAAAAKERQAKAAQAAKAAQEQADAEDAARTLGQTLGLLEGLTYPEHRAQNLVWWKRGSSVVAPTKRELFNPTRLREFANAVLALADELENAS